MPLGSDDSFSPVHPAIAQLARLPRHKLDVIARRDPALYAQIKQLLDFESEEREREEYEDSLIAFMQRAWREIDPAPLSINWHHEVIAEHLEAVTFGELRTAVINVPPRCTKSLEVNVLWPAWCWIQPPERKGPISGPQVSFLCVSYGATLSEEIALKMRRLVMGEWFQGLWGHRVRVMDDQQSRANFGNTAGGERISSSVEGGILGRGGDCVAAGTIVYTEQGGRRVEELEVAPAPRYILSYAPHAKAPAYRRLVAVARRRSSRIWRIHTRHGHVVEATGEHPFLTQRGWVQAMALAVGDVLLRCVQKAPAESGSPVQEMPLCSPWWGAFEAEEDTVSLVESLCGGEDREVFDVQVEGTPWFFANGILVHNCQIWDDIISPGEANSQVERERVLRAISEGLATRVKNPQTAARVLIMQRLHMDDPTNYALENWRPSPVHLMFPMRFDPNRACSVDPRRYDGELLWPEVWDEASVAKTEIELGDYGASAQFQQSPIPRSGGIISRDDWMIWPEWTPRVEDLQLTSGGVAVVPLPEVSHVAIGLDTALSEREDANWTACVVWGIWHRPKHLTRIVGREQSLDLDDGEQPRAIMMGAWRMRGKLNDETIDLRTGQPRGVVQRLVATARRFNADRVIIENKTRGVDVKNEIERQIVDMPFQIEMFEPNRHGDKVARLHSVQPLFSQGLVYAPANCRLGVDEAGNEYVDVQEFIWARDVMNEVEQVPKGATDDLADCTSMPLIVLRNDGYLALTREYITQQMALRMHHGRKATIKQAYGV